MLYICSNTISQDITKSGRSAHLQCIEWTIRFPVKYFISLESCNIQLSNSICYIFVALLYLKISPKAAAPLITRILRGPSPFLWHNEQTTWFSVKYLIPLESCDIQLSNSVCYVFVALLYPKISPKAAAPLITSALSYHLPFCGIMGEPDNFLCSILYQWKAVIYSVPTEYVTYL